MISSCVAVAMASEWLSEELRFDNEKDLAGKLSSLEQGDWRDRSLDLQRT